MNLTLVQAVYFHSNISLFAPCPNVLAQIQFAYQSVKAQSSEQESTKLVRKVLFEAPGLWPFR